MPLICPKGMRNWPRIKTLLGSMQSFDSTKFTVWLPSAAFQPQRETRWPQPLATFHSLCCTAFAPSVIQNFLIWLSHFQLTKCNILGIQNAFLPWSCELWALAAISFKAPGGRNRGGLAAKSTGRCDPTGLPVLAWNRTKMVNVGSGVGTRVVKTIKMIFYTRIIRYVQMKGSRFLWSRFQTGKTWRNMAIAGRPDEQANWTSAERSLVHWRSLPDFEVEENTDSNTDPPELETVALENLDFETWHKSWLKRSLGKCYWMLLVLDLILFHFFFLWSVSHFFLARHLFICVSCLLPLRSPRTLRIWAAGISSICAARCSRSCGRPSRPSPRRKVQWRPCARSFSMNEPLVATVKKKPVII